MRVNELTMSHLQNRREWLWAKKIGAIISEGRKSFVEDQSIIYLLSPFCSCSIWKGKGSTILYQEIDYLLPKYTKELGFHSGRNERIIPFLESAILLLYFSYHWWVKNENEHRFWNIFRWPEHFSVSQVAKCWPIKEINWLLRKLQPDDLQLSLLQYQTLLSFDRVSIRLLITGHCIIGCIAEPANLGNECPVINCMF